MINWIQKLTSRRFWSAIAGFAATILIVLNVDELTLERVLALIGALSVLVAYILGESSIDKKRVEFPVMDTTSAIGFETQQEPKPNVLTGRRNKW